MVRECKNPWSSEHSDPLKLMKPKRILELFSYITESAESPPITPTVVPFSPPN